LVDFVCTRCHAPIDAPRGELQCFACGTTYPTLGGVLCLVEDPVLFRDLWRTRLDDYVRAGEAQLKALAAEIERPDLFAGTRHRLEQRRRLQMRTCQASSTFRSLSAMSSGVNGFCMNVVLTSSARFSSSA